ncbi:GNAT family N-acetyltransferase [Luteolibacter marinus]|uniref:GNAT family N-acetyltransferase n=1 Tax=Luteolibacter marinus TaxID=2776705 RepID=UPI001866EC99|nr:GNAT family N-acetyltransferase [Luteolibacter marinus]
MATLTFLPITPELEFDCTNYEAVAEVMMDALRATLAYDNPPPWTGYLAFTADKQAVGIGAFKSPPDEQGEVELAWFTFPPYEHQGHGTRIARHLVELATAQEPAPVLIAHTEPAEGPSAKICTRLGFTCEGQLELPDDGPVWRWRRG